jgi:hypothetical protein
MGSVWSHPRPFYATAQSGSPHPARRPRGATTEDGDRRRTKVAEPPVSENTRACRDAERLLERGRRAGGRALAGAHREPRSHRVCRGIPWLAARPRASDRDTSAAAPAASEVGSELARAHLLHRSDSRAPARGDRATGIDRNDRELRDHGAPAGSSVARVDRCRCGRRTELGCGEHHDLGHPRAIGRPDRGSVERVAGDIAISHAQSRIARRAEAPVHPRLPLRDPSSPDPHLVRG